MAGSTWDQVEAACCKYPLLAWMFIVGCVLLFAILLPIAGIKFLVSRKSWK